MTIDDRIKDEKLQYNINKKAAKISALSSGKLHQYEYLTGEDILPSNQQQIIEQTKFTYSPLGKALDKQIKTIEGQKEKQVAAIKSDKKIAIDEIIPTSAFSNEEAKDKIDKINELEKKVDREKLFYEVNTDTYDFRTFRTIRSFGDAIYNGKITSEEANESQAELAEEIVKFMNKTKPKKKENKKEKEIVCKNVYNFYNGREMVLNAFKSKIFLRKSEGTFILNSDHSKLKILTLKQMLQRLPIALAQVKAGNNSENVLNKIRQIVYFYQAKEITKKVYNNIINSL